VYHGDAKDIFARRKKVQESIMKSVPTTVGPTPFSTAAAAGISTLAQPAQTALPQQTTGVIVIFLMQLLTISILNS